MLGTGMGNLTLKPVAQVRGRGAADISHKEQAPTGSLGEDRLGILQLDFLGSCGTLSLSGFPRISQEWGIYTR